VRARCFPHGFSPGICSRCILQDPGSHSFDVMFYLAVYIDGEKVSDYVGGYTIVGGGGGYINCFLLSGGLPLL